MFEGNLAPAGAFAQKYGMIRIRASTPFQQCCFPSCSDSAEHRHHVTYDPPVIKVLCEKHHKEITMLNGLQARKYRSSLSNKQRWWIWYQWMEGKLKPRRTRKALDYVNEWD